MCRSADGEIDRWGKRRQQFAARMGGEVGRETIGERIRRLRLARSMSQKALSRGGFSHSYVSRIEHGEREPTERILRFVARKLDVTVEFLQTGEPIPANKQRELQLADAELELRMGRALDKAETTLRNLIAAEVGDSVEPRAQAALGLLAAERGDTLGAIRCLKAAARSPAHSPGSPPRGVRGARRRLPRRRRALEGRGAPR
jgi:transcriptional regulator with XRE-family HTH domain